VDPQPPGYALPSGPGAAFARREGALVLPHVAPREPPLGTPDAPVARLVRPSGVATRTPAERSRPGGNGSLRARLVVCDWSAIVLTWIGLGLVLLASSAPVRRLELGVVGAVATVLAMRLAGLYRSRLCVRRSDELWRIVLAVTAGALAFAYAQHRSGTTGSQAVSIGAACIVALTALRWYYRSWLRHQHALGMYLRRVVLIGNNEDAATLFTMLRAEPELGFEVTGTIGDPGADLVRAELPWGAGVGAIADLARSTGANGVLIVPSALSSVGVRDAIRCAASAGLHVQIWPGIGGIASRRLRQVPASGEAFFYVEPKLARPWHRALKRLIDVVGSFLVLSISAPIILVAAGLIKLGDRGTVFHRQERIGLDGRSFVLYKLRTMTSHHGPVPFDPGELNERVDGPLFKSARDPRVTRVGRYLRATSIDELPQLWNVLSGSMSLVGPRPALPEETAQFDVDLLRRLTVRPGLTGLWQIEARDNPSFTAYRRLDLHYVDNWSLVLDLSILLSTPAVVLSHAARTLSERRQAAERR
jgi:exopolysaccharide biosynthesis polyprenyl glycosylphosphotransferase